jgi:hypothetical protein
MGHRKRLIDGKKTLIELREEQKIYCAGAKIIDVFGRGHIIPSGWYSEEEVKNFAEELPKETNVHIL